MKLNTLFITILFIAIFSVNAQESLKYTVFKNQPINFGGEGGKDAEVNRLVDGRIIYKKVTVPNFPKGTDVNIKLTLRSNGDRWDKSGSCFVVKDLDELSIISISKDSKEFPQTSIVYEKFKGIKQAENSVAYKHISLKPSFDVDDGFNVDASYETPYGKVVS